MRKKKKRKKSINYSHLPDVESISHGDLYVATDNVFIYKSLAQASQIQNDRTQNHSISEVFTVSIDSVLLLDHTHDISGNYRKCWLPMPGWVFFPQSSNPKSSIQTRPYGMVAIQNHPQRTRQKLLEDQEDKPNLFSRCLHSGFIKKIILYFREHPWLPNLIILFIQAGIEIVIFLDIVLDFIVIYDLFYSTWKYTFTIACVLLLSPYFIAWSVLFKFIAKNYKKKRYQYFTFFYTISPLGLLLLIINDLYHVIECVFLKPIHFIITCGRKLRSESFEELGYYKFRRVSEIFSESVMQAVVQLYILLKLRMIDKGQNDDNTFHGSREINPISVITAFLTSMFVIFLWIAILLMESKKNGMTFVEYITVVFQGSFKFVPYLPAIMRGKETGKKVNWIYFRIRNSSVGTIATALMTPLCQLELVKLSNYSIKETSRLGCKLLGNVLRTNNVQLIVSQRESHIKDLFDVFDICKSGAFDFSEFSRVMLVMRSFRAYSTNHNLLYSRMGNMKRIRVYSSVTGTSMTSSDGSNSDIDHKHDYMSDSDEKRDIYNMLDKIKDAEKEEVQSIQESEIYEKVVSDRTWTDSAAKVTIDELIESYKILADNHHRKVWLLDLLIKVRSSTSRLPCLDYNTPLYFAVKTNNIKLVSLLMSYGYHKKNREEFEHCVIECIVNQSYKMALVLCEHEGIPIVVHIRRGYGIKYHSRDRTSTLNRTRARAGLDEDIALNPFVTVTLFEQTSSTDIIYKSDETPLWNHYLLFIVPFDSMDDYIWLKQYSGKEDLELTENPLGMRASQSKSITKRKNIRKWSEAQSVIQKKTTQNRLNMLRAPSRLHMGYDNSMETHIATMPRPLMIRGDTSTQMFRSMRSMSSALSECNLPQGNVSPTFVDDAVGNIYNYHKKNTFSMDFKLYHHEYHNYNQLKQRRKYRKESGSDGCGFNDIELAYTHQNLFNYEELIGDEERRKSETMSANKLYGGIQDAIDNARRWQNVIRDCDADDENGRIEKEKEIPLYSSYETYFTTILNIKRTPFKGYKVKNVSLDCRIHLSALKCYELYGLDYIDKRKDDFGDLFDSTKYDDMHNALEPYPDYLRLSLTDKEKYEPNRHYKPSWDVV